MFKKIISALLVGLIATLPVQATTHTYPATDTNNIFTGANSFNWSIDATDPLYNTSSDACAAISNAANSANGTTFGLVIDARGFNGDQRCANSPFPAAYQGCYLFGATTFHIQHTILWSKKTCFLGTGWNIGSPASFVGSTVWQACSGAGAFCAGAFSGTLIPNEASRVAMTCFSGNGTDCSFVQAVFDSPVMNMTFDGNDQANIVPMVNCAGQENSGYFHDNGFNWANGLGMYYGCGGSGAQNSGAEWISLSIQNGHTCSSSEAMLMVNTGSAANAGPKEISQVTATAQACKDNAGSSGAPLYGVVAEGGPFSLIHIHIETYQTAAYGIGVDGVVTRAVLLEDINCGPCGVHTGNVPDWTDGNGVTCSVSIHSPCNAADAVVQFASVANSAANLIINVRMINIGAAGTLPNSIIDDALNHQAASNSEQAMTIYAMGDVGTGIVAGRTSIFSTSNQIANIMTAGLTIGNASGLRLPPGTITAVFPFIKTIAGTTDSPGAITINANTCTERTVSNMAGGGTVQATFASANYTLEPGIIVGGGTGSGGTTSKYRICNVTTSNIPLNVGSTFTVISVSF